MKIEDGKGSGKEMSVSSTQRGNVSAKTAPRIFYSSREDGLAYAAVFDDITAAAGEYVAYLQNTSSTRNMFLSDMTAGGVENIKWKLFVCTGTAASGESVTPTELNLSKSIPAEAIAMAGNVAITGLTAGEQIATGRSGANSGAKREFDNALILGPNDAIVLEYDAGTGGLCEATFQFHYEDIGAS